VFGSLRRGRCQPATGELEVCGVEASRESVMHRLQQSPASAGPLVGSNIPSPLIAGVPCPCSELWASLA
jgi:hypothetical protein